MPLFFGQSWAGRFWLWAGVVGVGLFVVFSLFATAGTTGTESTLTRFIENAKAGDVKNVEVRDHKIEYRLVGDPTTYTARIEEGDSLRQVLQDAGIKPEDFPEITLRVRSGTGRIIGLFLQFIPIAVIVGVLLLFLRQVQQSQTRAWPIVVVSETDPVCGEKVIPHRAVGNSTFQYVTYRFCSVEHKWAFDTDPVRYLLQK